MSFERMCTKHRLNKKVTLNFIQYFYLQKTFYMINGLIELVDNGGVEF